MYVTEFKNGKTTNTPIDLHRCNTEDYNNFRDLLVEYKSTVEYMKNEKPLYCIDEKMLEVPSVGVYGAGNRWDEYKTMTFEVNPCSTCDYSNPTFAA